MSVKTEVRKIQANWIAEVSLHGGMAYITIPKRIVEYYEIRLGDKLQIHATELKRTSAVAATEEETERDE